MNSADFLDQIRRQMDLPSDNQVAKLLGMPRERISMYRTGKREFDQDTCVAIAELLHEPPEFVLASIEAERAKSNNLKRVWSSIASMAKKGQAAGLALLAITGLLTGGVQDASAAAVSSDQFLVNDLYIIRIRLSRLLRKFRRNWGNVNRFGPQLCHTATAG